MLSSKNIILFLVATLVIGAIFYYLSPYILPQAVQPLSTYIIMLGMLLGVIVSFLVSQLEARKNALNNEIISLFVGNLPFKASNRQIQSIFSDYGTVHSVRIMTDKVTRKPRGYGFVEMGRADANAAIASLNGHEFMGRELKVNIATNRKQ